LSDPPKATLGGKPVLLLSGQADPIVPSSNSARLAALLSQAGASVTHKVLPAGHRLSQFDLKLARDWIVNLQAEAA
jgi:phospholipase/carboxylesterase